MDNREILAIYETVADLTDQMLSAARTGNWEQLATLESRCSDQVEILKRNDAPQQPLSPVAREQKIRFIQKILEDDREIRNITEPWMAQLSAMMSSTGTERKLAKAYGAGHSG